MAAKDHSFLAHHLICQLCSKPFSDPRMLPCLHSFCCQCLDHEVEKVGPQQNIRCPTCLSSVSIPMGGASRLPQNLHLGFEVEIAGYMSKFVSGCGVSCTLCVNGCTDPAVVFCCTCRQFMCTFGQISHKRVPQLAHHIVIGLDKESAELLPTVMKPTEVYCTQPKHETKELDLYCNTCSSLICNKCVLEYHNNHNIAPLSVIAKAHRDEMKGTYHSALGMVSTLAGAIEANKKMMQQVETSKQEAALAIEHAFGQLMETLEERKKALLAELEAISLSKVMSLTLQKEQYEKIQQGIGHHPEMISQILQTHSDHEVVTLGGLVPTELRVILMKVGNMSFIPNQRSYLKFSVRPDPIVKQLCQFGEVFGLSPAPHDSKCTFLSAVAKVNTKCHVKVETMSSNGERYPWGGLQVKGELRPKSHDGPVVPGEVEDHGDGTYTISLTPQAAGPHQLHVTMDGQHVQMSPYDLRVIDYTTLCNPQQLIKVSKFNPCRVAIHENGDIYVGSDYNIYVFDQYGHLKNTIGSKGSGNGQFVRPGLFIKGDVMYVADHGNNRIRKLTTEGKFLHKFGMTGSNRGKFHGPWDIVVDSKDRLIVSDSGNNRIQVFNQDGDWLWTIDGSGSGDHSFNDPRGLALDPDGNINVAAHGSNAVKVFTPEGTYIRTYEDVNGPIGIAIDEEGYSFVTEKSRNSLAIFDPQGHKIHIVGNINRPFGVALNIKDGSVYVSSDDVLKYTL